MGNPSLQLARNNCKSASIPLRRQVNSSSSSSTKITSLGRGGGARQQADETPPPAELPTSWRRSPLRRWCIRRREFTAPNSAHPLCCSVLKTRNDTITNPEISTMRLFSKLFATFTGLESADPWANHVHAAFQRLFHFF